MRQEFGGALCSQTTEQAFEFVIFHLFEHIGGKCWIQHLNKCALLSTSKIFDEIC